MAAMARSLLFLIAAAALLSTTVYSEILDYDNPDCVKNKDLDPEEEDNYMDCNTEETLAANLTRCCDVEGEIGCCENETKSDKMIWIGTLMGVCTASIGTACFIVFWCNPATCPCLKTIHTRCPCCKCWVKKDEFGEMTDLTDDMKKIGQVNASYVPAREHDEFAPPEKYDMPEELKIAVQDDWWGTTNQREAAF